MNIDKPFSVNQMLVPTQMSWFVNSTRKKEADACFQKKPCNPVSVLQLVGLFETLNLPCQNGCLWLLLVLSRKQLRSPNKMNLPEFGRKKTVGLPLRPFAWQVMDLLSFKEIGTIDPKVAAQEFVRCNGCQSEHHWEYIHDFLFKPGSRCLWHDSTSCRDHLEKPDLVLAGFPCSPYSAQRCGRFKDQCSTQLR